MPHSILICGKSGSGKTSLGERLKEDGTQDGTPIVHYDVDVATNGGDALAESGTMPTVEQAKNDSIVFAKLKEKYATCVAEGYSRLFAGEETTLAVWTDFYDEILADIASRHLPADTTLVVTHSVFLPEVREYLRARLPGPPVDVVVITVPDELATKRKVAQAVESAAAAGAPSVGAWLESLGRPNQTPEELAAAHLAVHRGFVPAVAGEIDIQVTSDMSFATLVDTVRSQCGI
mmetsp:Transcript_3903/g.12641  ORF Transcript_3903/g.12641 Transcript_3903/m.12641 type:complete len:234 (-) Transcript_3903:204-905(-)